MSALDLTVEQIRNGIESLPQELYNEVFTMTFVHDDVVVLDAIRKSPVQLQINQQTRQKFIQSYYGVATWLVEGFGNQRIEYYQATCKLVCDWLFSLSKDALSAFVGKERVNHKVCQDHREGRTLPCVTSALESPASCDLLGRFCVVKGWGRAYHEMRFIERGPNGVENFIHASRVSSHVPVFGRVMY